MGNDNKPILNGILAIFFSIFTSLLNTNISGFHMFNFFICDPVVITERLKTLVETRISEDRWVKYFSDADNAEWALSRYHSEHNNGGIEILQKLPLPATEVLINIALTADNTFDIAGASLELVAREKYSQEEFRQSLIDRISKIDLDSLTDFERQRISTIIYESELFDARNRREVTGKHATEIKDDAAFYKSVSEQALAILLKIGKDQ